MKNSHFKSIVVGMLLCLTVKLFSADTSTPRRVALVFDDGPVVAQTEKMLAVLAQANVHVTFSYIGKNVIDHPELARAAAQAGHEIANHSYTHPHLKTLSDDAIRQELRTASTAIEQATGRAPAWFWAPFLESDDRITTQTRAAGLSHFPYQQFHFISTDDWNVATTDIRDKTVILFHEWRPETLAELPAIIRELKTQHAVFLTFSEMARFAP
jgi:peptidoglycan/xylan/chitin deacetylase (PgdA/CDA1 family)